MVVVEINERNTFLWQLISLRIHMTIQSRQGLVSFPAVIWATSPHQNTGKERCQKETNERQVD